MMLVLVGLVVFGLAMWISYVVYMICSGRLYRSVD